MTYIGYNVSVALSAVRVPIIRLADSSRGVEDWVLSTVKNRDVFSEPTRMYSRRVSAGITALPRVKWCSPQSIPRTNSVFNTSFLLGPWMGFIVDLGQVLEIEVGVDLGGGDVGVTE